MSATRALVRHLIKCQVDNADHIYLISPLTETHALLLAAAEEVYGGPIDAVVSQIEASRADIERYRPLESQVERWRSKAERYERVLSTIAYGHPDDPTEIARAAIE